MRIVLAPTFSSNLSQETGSIDYRAQLARADELRKRLVVFFFLSVFDSAPMLTKLSLFRRPMSRSHSHPSFFYGEVVSLRF